MIKVDKLVAESVNVATKASLAWHHVLIVVNVLVHERFVLELAISIVMTQLFVIQRLTHRMGLYGFVRIGKTPELAANLKLNVRAGMDLVVTFEVNVNSVNAFTRVH